jgi:hypothetical protein
MTLGSVSGRSSGEPSMGDPPGSNASALGAGDPTPVLVLSKEAEMSNSSKLTVSAAQPAPERSSPVESSDDRQLSRWGGLAGLAGVVLMLGAFVVVGVLALPDASDVETLTDFSDIEAGRIAEHLLYLGALVLFALQTLVLHRLLRHAHPPAALFGTAVAEFGLVIMAASAVLHVSTSPLAELYNAPDASPEDRQAIEYAWHGAQSVFDTMLTTGVLLVPIGIVLLGAAMRSAPAFGPRLAWVAIALGTLGVVGAVIAVVDSGSAFLAASVLAIVIFYLMSSWRALTIETSATTELTQDETASPD